MNITFDDKEYSVEQILDAVAQEKDITLVYTSSNPRFLDSINHIGSKSAGDMSGWMFSINNKFPNTAINKTIVKDQDQISLVYTTGDSSEFKEME